MSIDMVIENSELMLLDESRSAYTVLVSVYHYHVPIHWCSFPHFNLRWKPRGKHLTSGPKFMLDVIHPQP